MFNGAVAAQIGKHTWAARWLTGHGCKRENNLECFLAYRLIMRAVAVIPRLIGRGVVGSAKFPHKLLRRILGKNKAKPYNGVDPVPS